MKFFVLLLASALLYPIYVVYAQLKGERGRPNATPAQWGAVYEDLTYIARDGIKLKGWWIPVEGSRKAVLLLHGKGGSRNGVYTGVFELAKWYHRRGYNVLLPDLRAHGESGGTIVYFGLKEHEDMLGWLEAIDSDHRLEWVLHGFSMGAATVLMMKAKSPKRFAYVVADAPWIDFEKLVKQELWKRAKLPDWSFFYVRWIAETFFGQNFSFVDNRERVGKLCGEKILYIFEADDALLPEYQRKALSAACPMADRALFEGAGHVEAFKNDPVAYTQLLESKGL